MGEKAIYTRPKTLKDRSMPYCPGCGHGIAHHLIAGVIDELGIREKTVGVAPVGCSVEAYNYLDVDMSESAHGRAPAVATGIKRARPDLIVFAYQGDGDLASIGLAEIIHAANRGENYTTVFINNTVYGMTGGQLAPTTLVNQKTSTSPLGRDARTMGYPMCMAELISTLESPYFVVRTALNNPAGVRHTRRTLLKAFQYQMAGKGFTFVEILSTCPTHWHLDPKKSMDYIGEVLTRVFPLKTFRDRGEEQK
jgi:2-oxoglutarate ferredoxin oxidoreductase subunit beta